MLPTANKNPLLDQLNNALSSLTSSLKSFQVSAVQPKPTAVQTPTSAATALQPTKVSSPVPSTINYSPVPTKAPATAVPQSSIMPKATTPAVASPPASQSSSELPYQTYERVTGQKYTGGTSAPVVDLLKKAGITAPAGSAEANLALQKYLTSGALGASSVPPPPSNPNAPTFPPGSIVDDGTGPKVTPGKPPSTAVTIDSLLEDFLGRANQPFDYATEAAKAKSGYESAFGTPESRIAGASAQTTALYDKAKTKALDELKGNLAVRGLYGGGQSDKELTEADTKYTGDLSAALSGLLTGAQNDELKAVTDLVGQASKSKASQQERLLSLIPSLKQLETPDYGSGIVGEYQFYADQEKAAGRAPMSFNDYATADANRKASASSAGLNATQLQSALDRVSDDYRQDPIVKQYATALPGSQFMASIDPNTTNPSDDIGMIYAFAKIMDPESVVREGEYATVQKYAQSWAESFGFNAARIFSNTKFLTADAIRNMKATAGAKMTALTAAQENARKSYQGRIDDLKAGKVAAGLPEYGTSDPASELDQDIAAGAGQEPTREALIEKLVAAYPEFTRDQIASRVYTLIPDR